MLVQAYPAILIFTNPFAFHAHALILATAELLKIHFLHKKKSSPLNPEYHVKKQYLDLFLWGFLGKRDSNRRNLH